MVSKSTIILLICIFTTSYINIVAGLEKEAIVTTLKASDDEILYQASVIVDGYSNSELDAPCAAAAVDHRHLVSIASCFTDEFGKPLRRWYKVRVGANNLKDGSKKFIGVLQIFIPENYNWETSDNNIAVIQVSQNLDLSNSNRLRNLELPLPSATYEKEVAMLSGYGHHLVNVRSGRLNTGTRDWHLRYLPVKVIDNAKCRKSHNSILDSQLCGVGIPEKKGQSVGACVGDLGGPLMLGNMLIGVLSEHQQHCDDTQEPAVYTRVSSVQPFIKSVLSGHPPKNTRIDTDQKPSRLSG